MYLIFLTTRTVKEYRCIKIPAITYVCKWVLHPDISSLPSQRMRHKCNQHSLTPSTRIHPDSRSGSLLLQHNAARLDGIHHNRVVGVRNNGGRCSWPK